MKLDIDKLAVICQQCFELSTSSEVKSSQRGEFLYHGKQLRGLLLNLITAIFESDDQAVLDANKSLASVNKNLKSAKESMENASKSIEKLTALATTLDSLLKLAAKFV